MCRAIFPRPGLERYAIQYPFLMRIIVKNGHISLEGFVVSEMDKIQAETAARSVHYAFSITDNL